MTRYVMRWRTCATPGCGRGFRSARFAICPECRDNSPSPRVKVLAFRRERTGSGAANKLRAPNRGHR